MMRTHSALSLLMVALIAPPSDSVHAATELQRQVAAAVAHFEGAESRFQMPDPQWLETTRQALREEADRVGAALDAQGEDYSAAWKKHLRWPLLTSNLGDASEVKLAELALVRRWLYSNRKGLETSFFSQLRERASAHLDAVFTFSQPDLEAATLRQVALARAQMLALAAEPSDAHAAALGRTLGWLERTRQLPDETAAVRSLLSNPNAQMVVSKSLIDRAIALFATQVDQSMPVSDRVAVPSDGFLGRSRTACVRGTAQTHGQVSLDLADSSAFADVQLVYRGEINSHCRAVIGPVTVAMQTLGPVRAVTPVQISLQGVKLITTEVFPQVQTKVTRVSASSELIRRLGKRRAQKPKSRQQMSSRAREKTVTLLREEMDNRVNTVIEEIRAELSQSRESFDSFQEVLAPVVREGATPRWESVQSTASGVTLNAVSQGREQFGAVTRCLPTSLVPDVQVRLHVSFFNNMAETIMAGKTFTDEYFMNYGKILQVQLPPPLMVHARSIRWALVAANPRPLEITIPAPNEFRIQLRMQRVEIGDDQFSGPSVATIDYLLTQNEFEEYQLERQGYVQLDSPLPAEQRDFLQKKLSAFFAPVLNAGGVALPEGGSLGRLSGLQSQGVNADRDWLTLGIGVPTEVLQQWLPLADE